MLVFIDSEWTLDKYALKTNAFNIERFESRFARLSFLLNRLERVEESANLGDLELD
jgi:hypothetical protein